MPSPKLAWCLDVAELCSGNRACTVEAWTRNFVGEDWSFFGLFGNPQLSSSPSPSI